MVTSDPGPTTLVKRALPTTRAQEDTPSDYRDPKDAARAEDQRGARTSPRLLRTHRQGQAFNPPGGDRPLKEGQGRRQAGSPEAHREELEACCLGGQEVPRVRAAL